MFSDIIQEQVHSTKAWLCLSGKKKICSCILSIGFLCFVNFSFYFCMNGFTFNLGNSKYVNALKVTMIFFFRCLYVWNVLSSRPSYLTLEMRWIQVYTSVVHSEINPVYQENSLRKWLLLLLRMDFETLTLTFWKKHRNKNVAFLKLCNTRSTTFMYFWT